MTTNATTHTFVIPSELNELDPTTPLHAVHVWEGGGCWTVAYNYDGQVYGPYVTRATRDEAMYVAQDIIRGALRFDPDPIDPDDVAQNIRDDY